MFADTLLESGVTRRSGRGWATTVSVGLQISLLAVLVVLPSVYPEMISIHRRAPVSVPIFSAAPVETPSQPGSGQSGPNVTSSRPIDVSPSSSRRGHAVETDPGPVGPPSVNVIGTGPGPYFPNATYQPPHVQPPSPTKPLIISHMSEGNLLQRVQPIYPPIARAAHIEGQVVLTAIISRTGTIESLHVTKGHPFLVKAAEEAVSQWRYRPYILNGEPIEVETQITVNFKLGS